MEVLLRAVKPGMNGRTFRQGNELSMSDGPKVYVSRTSCTVGTCSTLRLER